MLLKRFYDTQLAQASYMIACAETGEALIVDPNRDIAQYLDAASTEGVNIAHVTETHIHADFVSGSRELARATGAQLYLSDCGGADWKYAFAAEAGAVPIVEGSRIDVGRVRIDVLHTPGHTPEHCALLITDTASSSQPLGLLTGDFIFVGDVGRPDLLERAAGVSRSMDGAARQLYQSLQRTQTLPDYLQLWPGHGAGSACGKALGALPSTTLGYERLTNWAFQARSEQAFVDEVLAGQPAPPKYFATMKRLNRDGPRILGGMPTPPHLDAALLPELIDSGAMVIDTRGATSYAAGHVPGTLSIPHNKSFVTWAGWLVPYDRDVYLIADAWSASTAVRDLAMIGLDRIAGIFSPAAVDAWGTSGRPVATTPQITADDLAERMRRGEVEVIDVRWEDEYDEAHLPGVTNIPLGSLSERLAEIPAGKPVVMHCQGGGRSNIAASLAEAQAGREVINLAGGFGAWEKSGRSVVRD